jgi:Ni/Fe-hydrogenase subunit HybB-like protein
MTAITLPIIKKRVSLGTLILLALTGLGIAASLVRWVDGFSRMANISDTRPWGIWISFDLLVGIAISSGAFMLAAAVYIFRLEKYRPILRPALLTGFLGYLLEILALLVDLGQPQRVWQVLIYGNLNSPLFAVSLYVMTYTLVLFLEFIPSVLEKLEWNWALHAVKKITIPTVILGVILSILHQSSLGSLFLIVPYKMHPLWYSPLLPLVFLVSAIGVGFGMVVFESALSHRVFGGQPRKDIFQGLAKGLLVTLILLLFIKVLDLALAGELGLVFDGSFQGGMFILETVVGILLPIGILLAPRARRNLAWIFRAGLLTVLGLILNRLDIGLVGMAGAEYIPHWLELAVTVGLFSGGILVFGFAMKNLPLEAEG